MTSLSSDAVRAATITAHRVCREYNRFGDDDDAQDALVSAIVATRTHDATRSTLASWVAYNVEITLRTRLRRNARHAKRCRELLPRNTCDRRHAPHSVDEIVNGLSDDAKRLCLIVLVEPIPIPLVLARRDLATTPRSIRKALRTYCQEMGWRTSRIKRVFAEIREHLEGLA